MSTILEDDNFSAEAAAWVDEVDGSDVLRVTVDAWRDGENVQPHSFLYNGKPVTDGEAYRKAIRDALKTLEDNIGDNYESGPDVEYAARRAIAHLQAVLPTED